MNTDLKSKLQGVLGVFIFALLMAGKKIQVIKQVRELVPMGLKDAKDLVEAQWYEHTDTSTLDLNKVSDYFDLEVETLNAMKAQTPESGEVTQLRGLLATSEAKCRRFEEQHNDAIEEWRSDYSRLELRLRLMQRERNAYKDLYLIQVEMNGSED